MAETAAELFDILVQEERGRQDGRWGEQNHKPLLWLAILGEEYGELQKAVLKTTTGECFKVEMELIQVAAVAKAMFESGKRNGWL